MARESQSVSEPGPPGQPILVIEQSQPAAPPQPDPAASLPVAEPSDPVAAVTSPPVTLPEPPVSEPALAADQAEEPAPAPGAAPVLTQPAGISDPPTLSSGASPSFAIPSWTPFPVGSAAPSQNGTATQNGAPFGPSVPEPVSQPVMPGVHAADHIEAEAAGQSRGRRGTKRRLPTQKIFSDLAGQAAIPAAAYAIGEEVDGAMCLVRTDEGFEVFNSAGGSRHEVRVFSDEESAYFYLFGVLVADSVRTGALIPRE